MPVAGLFGVALGVEVVAGIAVAMMAVIAVGGEKVSMLVVGVFNGLGGGLPSPGPHRCDTALDLAERLGDLRSGS